MAEEPCKINTAVKHSKPLFHYYPHCDDDANTQQTVQHFWDSLFL